MKRIMYIIRAYVIAVVVAVLMAGSIYWVWYLFDTEPGIELNENALGLIETLEKNAEVSIVLAKNLKQGIFIPEQVYYYILGNELLNTSLFDELKRLDSTQTLKQGT